jgi:hypothetical protein
VPKQQVYITTNVNLKNLEILRRRKWKIVQVF